MAHLTVPPRKLLDVDWYILTVQGHEIIEKESTFKAGEKYHQIQWDFIADVPHESPCPLRAWTTVPKTATPTDETSKLLIALGVVSAATVVDHGLDLDLAVTTGRKCRGNVTQELSNKGVMQNRITDYAPLVRKQAPAAPVPADLQAELDEPAIPF